MTRISWILLVLAILAWIGLVIANILTDGAIFGDLDKDDRAIPHMDVIPISAAKKTPKVRPAPKLQKTERPKPVKVSICDLVKLEINTLKLTSMVGEVTCFKVGNENAVTIWLRARVAWNKGSLKWNLQRDIRKVFRAVVGLDIGLAQILVQASFRGHKESRWFKVAALSFNRVNDCKGDKCDYSIWWGNAVR